MRENYKILGIEETATDEEVTKAYQTLKAKYREERFLEGERGNEAARKLTQVETAYQEIMNERNTVSDKDTGSYDFTGVENALSAGNLTLAQQLLDEYNDRNAEWHYLQSVVFYKKNWTNESKKQLEIAMNMDHTNQKYQNAYTKLKEKIEFTEKQFHSGNANRTNTQEPYQERQMGGDVCGGAMDLCTMMCCMNGCLNCCCR